jgi:hypothetical protein
MPFVLSASAELVCPHQDPIVIMPSQRLLLVDGRPVLLRADLLTAKVPTCRNVGPGLTPCGGIVSIIGGLSTTLRVGGEPVALDGAYGLTAAVPGPVRWQVRSAGQAKLEAA